MASNDIKARKTQPRPISYMQGLHQAAFWLSLATDYTIPIKTKDYNTCVDLLESAIDYDGVEVMESHITLEFNNKWIKRSHHDPGFARR